MYSPEFKSRAIALAQEIGPDSAGPKLGIACSTLRRWVLAEIHGVRMSKLSSEEKAAARVAQKEIRKLKRENEELKKANWILRKVAEGFSMDRSNADLSRSETSSLNQKQDD